jgi:hypothetical protein
MISVVLSERCASPFNVDFDAVDMFQKQLCLLIIFVLSVVLCNHILFIGCFSSGLNVSIYIYIYFLSHY